MVATKERPILFSGPMVRAILSGRKTQTRRIMKPQPKYFKMPPHWRWSASSRVGPIAVASGDRPSIFGKFIPSERLWVRETFVQKLDDNGCFVYNAEGNLDSSCYHYAADGYEVSKGDGDGGIEYRKDGRLASPWRPSIFMPRHASRITLEITGVRVERLQEITEDDAIAEGAQCAGVPASLTNRGAFAKLWNEINGKRDGCSWESNPWVWVIGFKRED